MLEGLYQKVVFAGGEEHLADEGGRGSLGFLSRGESGGKKRLVLSIVYNGGKGVGEGPKIASPRDRPPKKLRKGDRRGVYLTGAISIQQKKRLKKTAQTCRGQGW